MGGAVVFQSGLAEQTGSQPICGSLVVERNFSAAVAPWHTSLMMRLRRPVLAAALAILASPCFAESSAPIPVNNPPAQNAFIDLLALMSGHCKTLKVAGRTFACKTVAYAHGDKGRVNFAVAVDDPSDANHVVSFSGENGQRADDNSYELRIDRMLLNSKDRPKVDGLPVPAEQTSTGVCRQTGNFAARKVTDVTCTATDSEGRRYELLFVSDGKPVSVRRIRQSSPSIQDPFK
ncbi:hypothetical protein ABIB94_005165 [Bradyrhizobium sp. JR7.2]|nr:hypothetical protein [Bradyrhizobium japonicum]MCP1961823.1 hypothetical protein [Bradyrhizobium japonicum]